MPVNPVGGFYHLPLLLEPLSLVLARAVDNDDGTKIRELLKGGCNLSDEEFFSLFFKASYNKKELAALALVEMLSPEASVIRNKSARLVEEAMYLNCKQVMLALLEKLPKEAWTAPDKDGKSPLHQAIMNGCTESALALVETLSDEDLLFDLDEEGDTLLKSAIFWGCVQTARALTQKIWGRDLNAEEGYQLLRRIIDSGDEQVILDLLNELSPEVLTVQDEDEGTLLHQAIRKGREHLALVIVEKLSASENLKRALSFPDCDGSTPLDLALYWDLKEVSLALIDALPPEDLSAENKQGMTPLYKAIIYSTPHYVNSGKNSYGKELGMALIDKLRLKRLPDEETGPYVILAGENRHLLEHSHKENQKEFFVALLEKGVIPALVPEEIKNSDAIRKKYGIPSEIDVIQKDHPWILEWNAREEQKDPN